MSRSLHLLRWPVAIAGLLSFALLWGRLLCAETAMTVPDEEIKLVWSANYGHGEQIYFSSYEKNVWTPPLQLSKGTEMVFQPAVSTGDDGTIWVVWARQDRQGIRLEYSFRKGSGWSRPTPINTGLERNSAVTVLVDPKNTPWIAWGGVDGKYEDIFWSRWSGGEWSPATKAHADNDVPDLQPTLALDGSGRVVLSWQTYANGKYMAVSRVWDGKQWQMMTNGESGSMLDKIGQLRQTMPPLPKFIQDPRKATLFIKNREGAWSFSLF